MCQATVGTPVFVEPVVEIVLVAQGCLKVCFGIAYTQAYNATETVVLRFAVGASKPGTSPSMFMLKI